MAYTPKDNYDGVSFVTAEDFNGLKELLNNECNRRRGVGSVQSYAGAVYQFSTKPAPGGYILAEHGQKLADPLRAINPNGIDKVESGSYIRMDAMAKRIAELGKKDAVSRTDTGCAASCTGLCASGCYTTCNGCTGSCVGSCSGSCTGSCTGSCETTCSGSCKGSCQGCTGTCTGT